MILIFDSRSSPFENYRKWRIVGSLSIVVALHGDNYACFLASHERGRGYFEEAVMYLLHEGLGNLIVLIA